MAKDIFKTRFSLSGFVALFFFALPYIMLWFPAKRILLDLDSCPKWLKCVYVFSFVALFLTIVLVKNESASIFYRKSRLMCIAYILLGVSYLLWVYFFLNSSNNIIQIFARMSGCGFLLVFSLDRKNWLAFSLSIVFLILEIVVSILAIGL